MQDIAPGLIQKAAAGDIAAFEEIYRGTSGFVYGTAFRVTMNKSDAEDITQEVFVKLYDNLKKFEFRSSFKTWVYRITVNAAINFIKRVKKNTGKNINLDMQIIASLKNEGSQSELEQKDLQGLVDSLLKELNYEQRACIVLREIEGLSYKDIAEALKININTVRSRLKRARQALLGLKNKEVIKNEL